MSTNRIPKRVEKLFPFGERIASGLDLHEVSLGVKQNTAAAVRFQLEGARQAQEAFQASRANRDTVGPELQAAELATQGFLAQAKKWLTFFLGVRWNERWNEAGFVNRRTAMPKTAEGRETLIAAMAVYFSKHPEHENAKLGVTAKAAKACYERLVAARKAVNSQGADQGALRENRDAAVTGLRRRLSATVSELRLLLDPASQRWEAFGLNMPGSRSRKGKSEEPAPLELASPIAKAA